MKRATEAITGGTAVGLGATSTQHYSDFLNTHGYLFLSYSEWIKVIGAVWVVLLIFKTLGGFKLVKWIWGKICQ